MSDEQRATGGEEQYDPPHVEEIPTGDGPAVTAAGDSPPQDDFGPEWRPSDPPAKD